ncbi:MAG: TetR family transcriptional regulator C-terminal domain-containing protein [Flavobacteriaceae bacterium]
MTAKKGKEESQDQMIISKFMEYVLENETVPRSIYKFCKEANLKEADFYKYFGSIDGLKKSIWVFFFRQTHALISQGKDYESMNNKERLLTFYFTFFELLNLNRSYVLFALSENKQILQSLSQLRGLRSLFKAYTKELIAVGNATKTYKVSKRNPELFSEGAWVQFLFLLKFWMEDDSAGFEKTDMAIEKSVQTAFDLFDNTPLDSILDFGKFLVKEKMV